MHLNTWMCHLKWLLTFPPPIHHCWLTWTTGHLTITCASPFRFSDAGFLIFGSCSEHVALFFAIPLTDFATKFTLYYNSKMLLYPLELVKQASFTQGCMILFFSQLSDVTFHWGCGNLKRLSLPLLTTRKLWIIHKIWAFIEPTGQLKSHLKSKERQAPPWTERWETSADSQHRRKTRKMGFPYRRVRRSFN